MLHVHIFRNFSGVVCQFLNFISFLWERLEIDCTLLLIAILTWWITALYKNKFSDDFKLMFVFQNVCFVTLFQKSSKQFSSLVLYSLFLLVILRLQKLLLDFLVYTFINLMSSHNLIIFVLTFSSSLTTFRTLCPCFNLIR